MRRGNFSICFFHVIDLNLNKTGVFSGVDSAFSIKVIIQPESGQKRKPGDKPLMHHESRSYCDTHSTFNSFRAPRYPGQSLLRWDAVRGLGFTKEVFAFRKHLVVVILAPPDLRAHPGELPDAINFLVPDVTDTVSMAFDRNCLARLVGILLVRYTKLVVTDDLVIRNLLPSASTDEVLCLEQKISKESGVGGHGDEFIGGHSLPYLVEEGAVVNLHQVRSDIGGEVRRLEAGVSTDPQGGCNAFAETLPVLLQC